MTQPLAERLAGRGRRLIATLIDMFLVPALTVLLIMATGVIEHAEDYRDAMWVLYVFLLAVLSYLILNGYWLFTRGQTVGKRLMKVAIVATSSGERAAFWKLIFIRALFFPLLFVVIIPALAWLPLVDQLFVFRKSRRCLHDLAAGTSVVRVLTGKPSTTISVCNSALLYRSPPQSKSLAAFTSSNRLTGIVCGAPFTNSGSLSASFNIATSASTNPSNSSFASVSVGSIKKHSGTSNGKYVVGE